MELVFWCLFIAACWGGYDYLRAREKRRWIEKNFFAGWRDRDHY